MWLFIVKIENLILGVKTETIRHKSQQDPLWPTSQNIRNKSKNKQMGTNET